MAPWWQGGAGRGPQHWFSCWVLSPRTQGLPCGCRLRLSLSVRNRPVIGLGFVAPPGSRTLRKEAPGLGGPAFRGPDTTERAEAAQRGSWPDDRALRTGLGSSHQDAFQVPAEVQPKRHLFPSKTFEARSNLLRSFLLLFTYPFIGQSLLGTEGSKADEGLCIQGLRGRGEREARGLARSF